MAFKRLFAIARLCGISDLEKIKYMQYIEQIYQHVDDDQQFLFTYCYSDVLSLQKKYSVT